jgi:hypothetical protein
VPSKCDDVVFEVCDFGSVCYTSMQQTAVTHAMRSLASRGLHYISTVLLPSPKDLA